MVSGSSVSLHPPYVLHGYHLETGYRMVLGSSVSLHPPYVLHGYHLDTGYRMVFGSSVSPLPPYVLHGYHLDTGYRMVFGSSVSPSPQLITGAEHAFIIRDSCHYAPLRTRPPNCRQNSEIFVIFMTKSKVKVKNVQSAKEKMCAMENLGHLKS
jgi:hypothetical protein